MPVSMGWTKFRVGRVGHGSSAVYRHPDVITGDYMQIASALLFNLPRAEAEKTCTGN